MRLLLFPFSHGFYGIGLNVWQTEEKKCVGSLERWTGSPVYAPLYAISGIGVRMKKKKKNTKWVK